MTRSVESHEAKWVTKVAAPCQARDATTFRVIAPIIGSGSVAADADGLPAGADTGVPLPAVMARFGSRLLASRVSGDESAY